ncbi:MAG: maleylacetoacetate isomerase [Proteobacteria bacterium]|jgi:maleylacetoacetate isomerase|nr:maleylacetoacetate isomerase [Pseudomonadota bacterium]
MSEFKLYSYFRSSTSYRTRIAFHLKEVPYEFVGIHLVNNGGEQHSAAYKRLNPASEVPTLIHGPHVIAQSMAIIEYLDEVMPFPKLFSGDAIQRAKIRQFCETINCTHPYHNLKTTQYLEEKLAVPKEQRDLWIQHWISSCLKTLESLLPSQATTFCFTEDPSAADCFLIPQLFSAQRFGVKLESYPRLAQIERACLELDAFKQAHPYRQPDTPSDLKLS